MNIQPITVAYVLTSNGEDIYADMNLISLWSLRQSNPNIAVVLVCDTETAQALQQSQNRLTEEVDQLIAVNVPSHAPGFRNRYLKTSIRKYIDGALLYLDGDTLVRDDLSSIFSINSSLAGVPNHNGTGSPLEIPPTEKQIFKSLNWPLPSEFYVNGGVLFLADLPEVYSFCDLWHQKWLACSEQTCKHNDQPSLNSAINDSQINFTWLEHRFNAQVHARPHTAWGAGIWHIYLSETHPSPKTVLNQALAQLQENRFISASEISETCQRSHPWTVRNFVDFLAIQSLKHQTNILDGNQWERLWLAGQYLQALKQFFHRIVQIIKNRLRLLKYLVC